MEAMDFIHTFIRYCDKQCQSKDGCYDCAFGKSSVCRGNADIDAMRVDEKFVMELEDWAKENPVKTRQSEFLKMCPNARIEDDGTIDICPDRIDTSIDCNEGCGQHCVRCRQNYWGEELR